MNYAWVPCASYETSINGEVLLCGWRLQDGYWSGCTCPQTAWCQEALEQPNQGWGGWTWRERPQPGPESPRRIPPARPHSLDTCVSHCISQMLALALRTLVLRHIQLLNDSFTYQTLWSVAHRWTLQAQEQTCSLCSVQRADWFSLDLQRMNQAQYWNKRTPSF